jgi:DNA-binding MarR family transcriptional regulator
MSSARAPGPAREEPSADEIEAVMLAARVLVAVSAQAVAAIEDQITLPQLRVLVMVASRGPLNLAAVAEALNIHPSNATRACDRLVSSGLLDRREDPADRRHLVLEPTASGRDLVERVMDHRRAAIADVLSRMPAAPRRALVPVMEAFAEAGGEIPVAGAWTLGWPTPGS